MYPDKGKRYLVKKYLRQRQKTIEINIIKIKRHNIYLYIKQKIN